MVVIFTNTWLLVLEAGKPESQHVPRASWQRTQGNRHLQKTKHKVRLPLGAACSWGPEAHPVRKGCIPLNPIISY